MVSSHQVLCIRSLYSILFRPNDDTSFNCVRQFVIKSMKLGSDIFLLRPCELGGWFALLLYTESEVQSELLCKWLFTANQFVLATCALRITTRYLFFSWTSLTFRQMYISHIMERYRIFLCTMFKSSVKPDFAEQNYTEIFYTIDKGDIPAIQCTMSLRGA
jgi:hypothetical protein